jgi:hypothetical protein
VVLRGAISVVLDPVGETGEHQIGSQKRVFGLLRHGSGQVGGGDLRVRQILTPRLLQLQIKQAGQAQAHRNDEQRCRLAQRQAFKRAGSLMRFVNGDWQKRVLGRYDRGRSPKPLLL